MVSQPRKYIEKLKETYVRLFNTEPSKGLKTSLQKNDCPMRNVGPILFMRNENIAHVMPRVTARAVMSCTHRVACACRQAGHPNYMWHARIYLRMCHSRMPNNIYQN